MKDKNKTQKTMCEISVADFAKDLDLQIIYPGGGKINIYDTGLNRPGLQFYGFYEYFDVRRIQTVGKMEIAYLYSLYRELREKRIDDLFSREIPCLIVCWDSPDYIMFESAAKKYNRPLFVSKEKTTDLSYHLVDYIDRICAPKTGIHGVLVEVHGVGVVITGSSGIGKSETALELIKRGNSFIADDVVNITCRHGNTLIGEAPELLRYYMEVRGIGIIDVRMLFGAESVKRSVEIDMVIQLENWNERYAYDRLGLDEETMNILGVEVPLVTIPVSGGRNIAGIIEAAAINNRLKNSGINAAQTFCDNLEKAAAEGRGID